MLVRKMLASVVAVLVVGAVSFAQEGEQPVDKKDGAGPVKRERRERPRFKEIGRADPGLVADDMAERLLLDDSQKTQVQQMVANFQATQRDLRKQYTPSDESIQRLTKLRDEMKAAHEANDNEKVNLLLEELKQIRVQNDELMRPLQEQVEQAKQELHNSMESIMRGEQRQKFAAYWEQHGSGRSRQSEFVARSPQALKAMVERLPGLTSNQKEGTDGLFKAYFESAKSGKRAGPEAETARKKLFSDVLALLTDEQRAKIEKTLGGEGGRGPGGRERGARNRDGDKGTSATGDAAKDEAGKGEAKKPEPSSASGG